jgi:hypothetical protein
MNESVFNGETFSGDTVLVCPNDGDLNLGVEIDQTVYLEGVYSATYGIPTFSAGLNVTAGTNPSVKGVVINLGIAESGTKTFEGGRFADATRSWEASEETAVTNWDKDDSGIYAVGLGATGGALNTLTPQLYWRNKTDAGSFAAVGASGEVKYTTVSGLTDESDVTSGEAGVTSGKSYTTCNQCEQENSHEASTTTDLADENWTELQIGISFADGDDGDEYEFSLYESAAQVGSASVATVTLCAPASDNADITFFWRAEASNFSGTNHTNCGGSGTGEDCSAGDDDLFTTGSINTTRVKMGTNSLDVDGGTYYSRFGSGENNIYDGGDGRFAFWYNRNAFNSGIPIYTWFAGGNYVTIAQRDSDELRLEHADGETETCTTTQSLSDDTWYWVEAEVDATNNELRLLVYTDPLGSTVASCENTSGTINDIGTVDDGYIGTYTGTLQAYMDHVVISSDPNTSLGKYADDPAYNDCT